MSFAAPEPAGYVRLGRPGSTFRKGWGSLLFDGEMAWITGSSKGIGRAVAIGLAEEGCNVAVHYNNSKDQAQEVVDVLDRIDCPIPPRMWEKFGWKRDHE
jgi:hypothetical protein